VASQWTAATPQKTAVRHTGAGNTLIQLLPLIIAAMAMPTWVLLVLFLLRARRGAKEAIAFVAGVTTVRHLQGLIFGAALGALAGPRRRSEWEALISALLLVTGVLMWAAAIRQLGKHVDPVGAPPISSRWETLIHSFTPARAFGVGAVLVAASSRAWLFTLAAISVIGQAAFTPAESLVAFAFYVLGAELLLIAPIILSIRAPARFAAAAAWLERHERPIVIAVSIILGSYFLWTGIHGLAG
jgi:cytochrome c biogenesis protein CcdA